MPYQWISDPDATPAQLHLWPHRSLPKTGFVTFIGLTSAFLAVPLLSQLGTPGLWVLLPFLGGAVAAIWIALQHSYRIVTEDLTLTPDLITLHRHNPRGPDQDWQANPHWVRATLHPTGGPVPQYLTLSGGGREVELGAFLTPQERQRLHGLLRERLKQPAPAPLPLDP